VEIPEGTGASKVASKWQTRLQGGTVEQDEKEVKKTKVEMPEGTGASKVASVWQTRLQGGEEEDKDKDKDKDTVTPRPARAGPAIGQVWEKSLKEDEKEKEKDRETAPTPKKGGPTVGSLWEKNVSASGPEKSTGGVRTSELDDLKKMMQKEKDVLMNKTTEPEIAVEGEEASKVLFGFMNKALDGLKGIKTPLDSEDPDSWQYLSDGISMCHFFDKMVPDVLDIRALTKKISSDQDKIDNWNLCVNSARGSGCRLNDVKVNLLATGDVESIKKVIWQIIKVSCEVKVRAKKDYLSTVIDEDIETALKWPLEKLLIAWANVVVKKTGQSFSATSITTGFKDVNMYIILLDAITGCGTDALSLEDNLDRAIEAEANVDLLEEGTVIIAEGILDGIYWMNYAFLSVLLIKAAEKAENQ